MYSSDPDSHPGAMRFDHLSYREVLLHDLRVMDHTAIAVCKENNIPIVVFSLFVPGNIVKALVGDNVGTTVSVEGNTGKATANLGSDVVPLEC